jgi:starch synthase
MKAMPKRVYFLTTEIVPFAETYPLATFAKEIPMVLIERKYDLRVMMPKYQFISERRYILREVIRLREMDITFHNKVIKGSVKSAFIPNTKVQVYFLEHENYFQLPADNLYLNDPLNPDLTNFSRLIYFAGAALTTLNYLRWKPEIIICNDWQMSLIPLFINAGIIHSDYLEGVKILQIIHSYSEQAQYPYAELKKIGLTDFETALSDTKVDALAASLPLCHQILFVNYNNNNLLQTYAQNQRFSAILRQEKEKIASYNLTGREAEDWQKLANEIINLLDKM